MAENQTTAAPETAAEPTAGRVTRIQGSVIDVEFPVGHLPDIYNALTVELTNTANEEGETTKKITLEVEQHLGDSTVRTVALKPTDGLVRGATVLDTVRNGLHGGTPLADIVQGHAFGLMGGAGWEWIAFGYALGGAFLLWRGIITWHMPTAFLLTFALLAGIAWLAGDNVSPLFHLMSGGTLLAAFFIVTDPVSGTTTPRGKLIFAAGAALIAFLIRSYGNYPDGIAFAVLLMNVCAPLIDMKTQPPVFGHRGGPQP